MAAYDLTNIKNKKPGRWLLWGLFIASLFLIVIFGAAGYAWRMQQRYVGQVLPGVHVGQMHVGGYTKEQLLTQLKGIEGRLQSDGITLSYQDHAVAVHPIVISVTDPDLAREIMIFYWSDIAEEAMAVGRGGNWLQNAAQQISLQFSGYRVPVRYYLNRDELKNILKENFGQFETPPLDAKLTIVGESYEIEPEASGQVFNYDQVIDQLVESIEMLEFKPITLALNRVEPLIKKANTGSAVNSLEHVLAIDSITLTVEKQSWTVTKQQLINWLEFQKINNELVVGLNKAAVLTFFEPIAAEINVAAQDAKFELVNDRVTEFQPSIDGKAFDVEKSYDRLNQQVISGQPGAVELVVAVDKAKVATTELNDLGINELLGRGTSNFAGSPVNRRHNIGIGAGSLNGILIKPEEEFSLLDALGEIDASQGYRQELVIKGDRTIPEYGGGLCQIGTTTFRAALAAGLPITARRNHSYRVRYYEPPVGMDATIYDPAPDFRFINDTGHHILFITRIEGDQAIFEFYGTSDGRVASTTEPVVYNITSPGEPRYIETDQLAPGEKKKVESAHNGASAWFKYSVLYPDGELKEEVFNSQYVAWKETWLVGIQSSSTDAVTDGLVEPTVSQ